MAKFEITGPDGKKYRIEGDNAQGALQALKNMLGDTGSPASAGPAKSAHISETRGPDGMTTAERIAAAKAGTLKDPRSPDQIGRQAGLDSLAENNARQTSGQVFMGNIANGLTFGFADNITNMLTGGGDAELAAMRDKRKMDEATFPKSTLAADITGSIAGAGIGVSAAAPKAITMIPKTTIGKAVTGLFAGGTTGALEGGLSGAGYADGKNVGEEALRGAKIGGLLGGGIGVAAPVVASGTKALLEWAKGYDAKIISRTLGIDRKSAEMLKASMAADDPAKAIAAMGRAGDDAMLADAGKGTAQLLDTAMQSSGGASRIAGDRIEARAAKAGKKVEAIFDSLLGKADDGIKTAATAIAKKSSSAREAAYERALSQPIDYASNAGRAVEDVVARIPDDILNRAVKSANDALRIDGKRAGQIMASISDDGTVTFTKPLDAFQLNEVKKAVGELKRAAVDQFGRPTGEGIRLGKIETQLRDAIAEAVPGYKGALKLASDKIAEDRGLELGRKMLSPNVTREQVAEGLKDASKDAIAATKRGLRIAIDEAMSSVKAVLSDQNIDAREALKMVKEFSSKSARQKATDLLGPGRAQTLFDALDEATAHLELRAAVARNSATAARTTIQDEAKRIVGDSFLDAVRDGRPLEATKRVMRALTGGSEARKAEELRQLYTTVADVLTKTRGADAQEAMRIVAAALQGQTIKTEDAAKVANLLVGSATLGGYQAGMQSLGRPQSAQ